jgi:hypothetical protein
LASYNVEAMELVDREKSHLVNTQQLLRTHDLVSKPWGRDAKFKFGPKTGLVELITVPWFDSHIYELSEGKICIPSDDRSCIQMNVANGQLITRVVNKAHASRFEGKDAIHLVYKNSLFKLSRGREYDSQLVSIGTDSEGNEQINTETTKYYAGLVYYPWDISKFVDLPQNFVLTKSRDANENIYVRLGEVETDGVMDFLVGEESYRLAAAVTKPGPALNIIREYEAPTRFKRVNERWTCTVEGVSYVLKMRAKDSLLAFFHEDEKLRSLHFDDNQHHLGILGIFLFLLVIIFAAVASQKS